MSRFALAIDIGGTFTDAVLTCDDGRSWSDKTLTTQHDLLEGFFRAADLVLARGGVTLEDLNGVVAHATTVVTNALIERKGAADGADRHQGLPRRALRSATSTATRCTIRRSSSPSR